MKISKTKTFGSLTLVLLLTVAWLTGTSAVYGLESTPLDATRNTDNTLKLPKDTPGQAAEIGELAWLAGYWTGTGLGGETEEMWTPPSGDRMHGVFTLRENGKLNFHESMILVEKDGSLVLRLKHFDADFVGWEEKSDTVDFRLVKTGDNEAYFNGLTFRREGKQLTIYLAMRRGEELSEVEFKMTRTEL
jgi:hypothetical protein